MTLAAFASATFDEAGDAIGFSSQKRVHYVGRDRSIRHRHQRKVDSDQNFKGELSSGAQPRLKS